MFHFQFQSVMQRVSACYCFVLDDDVHLLFQGTSSSRCCSDLPRQDTQCNAPRMEGFEASTLTIAALQKNQQVSRDSRARLNQEVDKVLTDLRGSLVEAWSSGFPAAPAAAKAAAAVDGMIAQHRKPHVDSLPMPQVASGDQSAVSSVLSTPHADDTAPAKLPVSAVGFAAPEPLPKNTTGEEGFAAVVPATDSSSAPSPLVPPPARRVAGDGALERLGEAVARAIAALMDATTVGPSDVNASSSDSAAAGIGFRSMGSFTGDSRADVAPMEKSAATRPGRSVRFGSEVPDSPTASSSGPPTKRRNSRLRSSAAHNLVQTMRRASTIAAQGLMMTPPTAEDKEKSASFQPVRRISAAHSFQPVRRISAAHTLRRLSIQAAHAIVLDELLDDSRRSSVASATDVQALVTSSRGVVDDSNVFGDGTVTINQYVLLSEIGRGAQGRVMLAMDESANEFRAVKILPRPKWTSTSATRQCQHEISVMKRLRHRNLVSLYEVIDDPALSSLYLVMEYIEHGPLVTCAPDGTTDHCLAPPRFIKVARQLCAGLRYMHSRNTVHGDLKPDNILQGASGDVYLADFGMSHAFKDRCVETPDGPVDTADSDAAVPFSLMASRPNPRSSYRGVVGSAAFCPPEATIDGVVPPEQASQDAEEGETPVVRLAKAADVWALGVSMYMLLYGKLPFAVPTPPEDVEKQYQENVRNTPITVETLPTEVLGAGSSDDDPDTPRDETVPLQVRELIAGMLVQDVSKRWRIEQCHKHIRNFSEQRRRSSVGITLLTESSAAASEKRRTLLDRLKHGGSFTPEGWTPKAAGGSTPSHLLVRSPSPPAMGIPEHPKPTGLGIPNPPKK